MSKWRELKFAFINTFLAPVGIRVLRLWMSTWREEPPIGDAVAKICEEPRLIAAALHGATFCLPRLANHTKRTGRVACALASPSRDGRLEARVLHSFGIETVHGSSRSKGVAGSRGIIDAINDGRVGFIVVDGPRGPAGVPKEGIARIARLANAKVVCVSVGCSRAIRFRSWDGLFLPLPFARITYDFRILTVPPDDEGGADKLLGDIETALREDHIRLNSPLVARLQPRENHQ
ncbi:DUF374 domain-containing protein [bacterium]|nr:DUF374 domain-containing protein [bacterium]